jgi:HEAT repeat protein
MEQIEELLEMLNGEDLEDRLTASQVLSEIGNADALRALRARLRTISEEHQALVIAVGKLKRKLGVK